MLADFSTVLGRLFSLPHSFLLLCIESTVWAGSSSEKNPVRWQPYWYLNCWTYCRCKTLVVSILVVDIHSAAITRESSFRLLQMTFSAWLRISFELLLCYIMPKTSAWNSGRFLTSWQKSHLFGPKFCSLVLLQVKQSCLVSSVWQGFQAVWETPSLLSLWQLLLCAHIWESY